MGGRTVIMEYCRNDECAEYACDNCALCRECAVRAKFVELELPGLSYHPTLFRTQQERMFREASCIQFEHRNRGITREGNPPRVKAYGRGSFPSFVQELIDALRAHGVLVREPDQASPRL